VVRENVERVHSSMLPPIARAVAGPRANAGDELGGHVAGGAGARRESAPAPRRRLQRGRARTRPKRGE